MASLHKVSDLFHSTFKWGAVLIGAIFILLVVIRGGLIVKEMFFPTPIPPPTVSFGKVSYPSFPKSAATQNLTYSINTLSGFLPSFPDRITIYKTTTPPANLLALQRAQEKASALRFRNSPIQLSKSLYQWTDQSVSNGLNQKLTLDIFTYNFDFTTDYLSTSFLNSGGNLPKEDKAVETATQFISSLSLPSDLDLTKTKTTFLTFNGTTIVPAANFSKAKLIRVDFFEKNINGQPIFYQEPYHSNIYALIAGGSFNGQVVEAHSFHLSISNDSATYPIKTANDAFGELKKGRAFIQYSAKDQEIRMNNASVAYFIGIESQDYILPIIVFEGDNGFVGYVKAIKDEWIEK